MLTLQPRVREDLFIQQRSVKQWCEAQLNLDRMCDSVTLTILREIFEVSQFVLISLHPNTQKYPQKYLGIMKHFPDYE